MPKTKDPNVRAYRKSAAATKEALSSGRDLTREQKATYGKTLRQSRTARGANPNTGETATKMQKATVAKKGGVNYQAGVAATPGRGSKANLMRRGASVNPALTRKSVRTTIKAGLRERKPGLSTKQVKGRANKQTAAIMKKRAK